MSFPAERSFPYSADLAPFRLIPGVDIADDLAPFADIEGGCPLLLDLAIHLTEPLGQFSLDCAFFLCQASLKFGKVFRNRSKIGNFCLVRETVAIRNHGNPTVPPDQLLSHLRVLVPLLDESRNSVFKDTYEAHLAATHSLATKEIRVNLDRGFTP